MSLIDGNLDFIALGETRMINLFLQSNLLTLGTENFTV